MAAARGAVILAHNYQLPEVQDVADYVGDSLGLSRQAAAAPAGTIVFCGVHFMAETASILCPEKTVLIPDLDAGCSLAASIDAEQLEAWKAEHPAGVVVMYVNTTAEVKALTDYCVTSANAVEVVRHIYETHGPQTEILFGPDMWLGAYVEKELGKPMHVWDGECHVHAGIRPADIETTRAAHPGSRFPDPPRVWMLDERDGVCGGRGHRLAGCAHALDRRDARVRPRGAARGGLGEAVVATEDGHAPSVAHGLAPDQLHRGQPGGELRLHEDDHAAEAQGLAARAAVRGQGARADRPPRARADRPHGRARLRI